MKNTLRAWTIFVLTLSCALPTPSIDASCYGGGCVGSPMCCGVSCYDPYQMIGAAAVLGGIFGAATGYAAGRARKGERGDRGKHGEDGLPGPTGPTGPAGPPFEFPTVDGTVTVTFTANASLTGGVLRGVVTLPDQTIVQSPNLMPGGAFAFVFAPDPIVGAYTLTWLIVTQPTALTPQELGTITATDGVTTADYVTEEFFIFPNAGDQVSFHYIFPVNS